MNYVGSRLIMCQGLKMFLKIKRKCKPLPCLEKCILLFELVILKFVNGFCWLIPFVWNRSIKNDPFDSLLIVLTFLIGYLNKVVFMIDVLISQSEEIQRSKDYFYGFFSDWLLKQSCIWLTSKSNQSEVIQRSNDRDYFWARFL